MNSILSDYWPTFTLYQSLREQLLDLLDDGDLAFQPTAANSSLGALCRQIGEVEYAYIQSFRTFRIDFGYRNETPGLGSDVIALRAWYETLDADLKAAVGALSEDDLQTRMVDRGGWEISPRIQLEIYKEALLIFYGKVSVYLHALGKTLPDQWQNWIG